MCCVLVCKHRNSVSDSCFFIIPRGSHRRRRPPAGGAFYTKDSNRTSLVELASDSERAGEGRGGGNIHQERSKSLFLHQTPSRLVHIHTDYPSSFVVCISLPWSSGRLAPPPAPNPNQYTVCTLSASLWVCVSQHWLCVWVIRTRPFVSLTACECTGM